MMVIASYPGLHVRAQNVEKGLVTRGKILICSVSAILI